MTKTADGKSTRKEKAKREFRDLIMITMYLAFFFCALTTYSMLLLNEFNQKSWGYGFALINALVITKVVMIGNAAKVGTKYEARPLLLSALYKAFVYWLLVLAFHFVEELIKRLVHGANITEASGSIRLDELLGRSIVVFCTFIPLFAFLEFRRVLGEEKFQTLLFRSEAADFSDSPASN